MGMNLHIYVGPYVLLGDCQYLKGNHVNDLCEYRLGQKVWCPHSLDRNVLLPNVQDLSERSFTYSRDSQEPGPLVDPDIEEAKDWFQEAAHGVLFKLEALDIPYNVFWGVFSYWI